MYNALTNKNSEPGSSFVIRLSLKIVRAKVRMRYLAATATLIDQTKIILFLLNGIIASYTPFNNKC